MADVETLKRLLADAPPWRPTGGPEPAADTGGVVTTGKLRIMRMASIKPEPIEWLWEGRLPRGKLVVVMGDPGQGKSLLSHWVTSTLSRGGEWPDGGQAPKGASILFTNEDDLADTVRPRLDAAGADVNLVYAVEGVRSDDDDPFPRLFKLNQDLALLETALNETGAICVCWDPIEAYLGDDVNAHKSSDVRAVLTPLAMLAQRTGACIVMLMHLNKGTGSVQALYRAMASIAFVAQARVVLGVASDPSEDGKRLILPVKMNIGREPAGLSFRIKAASMSATAPPVIEWDSEPVSIRANDAMDPSGTASDRNMTEDVKSVLRQFLPLGASRPAQDCWRAIKEATGCSSGSTVTNAKRQLGIKSRQLPEGSWLWENPLASIGSYTPNLESGKVTNHLPEDRNESTHSVESLDDSSLSDADSTIVRQAPAFHESSHAREDTSLKEDLATSQARAESERAAILDAGERLNWPPLSSRDTGGFGIGQGPGAWSTAATHLPAAARVRLLRWLETWEAKLAEDQRGLPF